MPTQTLLQLRTSLRQMTDTENDTHVSDTELNGYINKAIAYFYDVLVEGAPSDYFAKEHTVTTVPGQEAYPLPTDFYRMRMVYVQGDQGRWYPLMGFQEEAMGRYQAPTRVSQAKLLYIPQFAPLAADDDTFEFFQYGWEELPLQKAALDIKAKREEDATSHYAAMRRQEERIRAMSDRDAGRPERVVVRRSIRRNDPYFIADYLKAYRIRGQNINLYELRVLGW